MIEIREKIDENYDKDTTKSEVKMNALGKKIEQ